MFSCHRQNLLKTQPYWMQQDYLLMMTSAGLIKIVAAGLSVMVLTIRATI